MFVEETLGGTVVAVGDAALPRPHGQQELDLLAIVDDSLIAYEVKTRYMARNAGRLTRTGNLSRPRLRRAPQTGGNRQGSQDYVTARIDPYVDVDDDYEGVDVRVLAVDLKAMLAQQFVANDAGTRVTPLGPPSRVPKQRGKHSARSLITASTSDQPRARSSVLLLGAVSAAADLSHYRAHVRRWGREEIRRKACFAGVEVNAPVAMRAGLSWQPNGSVG